MGEQWSPELGRGEESGSSSLGVHRPRDHQGLMGRLAGVCSQDRGDRSSGAGSGDRKPAGGVG